jgi:hypothetical protein
MTFVRAIPRAAVALAKEDVPCSARISLARRSISVGGCSMKITEEVRKYAAEQGLAEAEVLESGLQERRKSSSKRAQRCTPHPERT